MLKYTPGPWGHCGHPQPCECGYIFGNGGQIYVAKALNLADEVDPVASESLITGNVRLLAAAPELLEALKRCKAAAAQNYDPTEEAANPNMREIGDALDQARAAIDKAEGRDLKPANPGTRETAPEATA